MIVVSKLIVLIKNLKSLAYMMVENDILIIPDILDGILKNDIDP